MRFGHGMHAAGVANPTSPVQQRIAVRHLAPEARNVSKLGPGFLPAVRYATR